jgi:hypothetical protein
MDWKRFYAAEIAGAPGRAALLAAVARHAAGDAAVMSALQAGGAVSFPHVSVHDSADPLARVAQSVLALGAPRVLALGVLHGGTLPAPFQAAQQALRDGTGRAAQQAFADLGGAFVARGPVHTPFGPLPEGPRPTPSAVLREHPALLAQEFSLDVFLATLAAAAQARGVAPPAVTRVFVSATRDPAGGFDTATALAAALRPLLDDGAVWVTTGDVAHIGHGYSPAAQLATLPGETEVLHQQLLAQVQALHHAALAQRDQAAAWAGGSAIQSDQRHLLPLLAQLLGPGASAQTLDFRLSDYAAINGQPAPCWVAAALTVFQPGHHP